MDVLHREISTLAAAYAVRETSSGVGIVAADWRPPPRSRTWRRLTLLAGLSTLIMGWARTKMRPDRVFIDQWHPWMTMHVSQYGLSDHLRSYLQVYRYDRASLRSCLWRGLVAARRYHRGARRAASQWCSAQEDLASWARWERTLGLAPHVPADRIGTKSPQ